MPGVPEDIAALQAQVAKLESALSAANAARAALAARVDVLEAALNVRVQTAEEANRAALALVEVQRQEIARQAQATASMAATLRDRAPAADFVAAQRARIERRKARRKVLR